MTTSLRLRATEISRWPRHMRTHVWRRRAAHARPSTPSLSPASGYPSADEHVCSFHVLAIENSAAMNIGVHVCLSGFIHFYAQQWDCWVISLESLPALCLPGIWAVTRAPHSLRNCDSAPQTQLVPSLTLEVGLRALHSSSLPHLRCGISGSPCMRQFSVLPKT